MAIAVPLVVHAILYFLTAFVGFALAIAIGVPMEKFGQSCMLYTKMKWSDVDRRFHGTFTDTSLCVYPLSTAIASFIYGAVMGVFTVYSICTSSDPTLRFGLCLILKAVVSGIASLLMFIASCIISVGLKVFCDSFYDNNTIYTRNRSCAQLADTSWETQGRGDSSYLALYTFTYVAQVTSWVTFLLWLGHTAVHIFTAILSSPKRQARAINESSA